MGSLAFERNSNWRHVARLVRQIYHTTDSFPSEEKSGLTATLRRTAIAMPAQLAKGIEQQKMPDAIVQVHQALREISSGMAMAKQLGFLSGFKARRMRRRINRTMRRLDRSVPLAAPTQAQAERLKPTLHFRYAQRAA